MGRVRRGIGRYLPTDDERRGDRRATNDFRTTWSIGEDTYGRFAATMATAGLRFGVRAAESSPQRWSRGLNTLTLVKIPSAIFPRGAVLELGRVRAVDDHDVVALEPSRRRLPAQRRDALGDVALAVRRDVLERGVAEDVPGVVAEQLAVPLERLLPLSEGVEQRAHAAARAGIRQHRELALRVRRAPLLPVRRRRAPPLSQGDTCAEGTPKRSRRLCAWHAHEGRVLTTIARVIARGRRDGGRRFGATRIRARGA